MKSADALIDSAVLIEPKLIAFWESWKKHKIDSTHEITSDKYIGIYYLLISFAIENYLKAVLVKKSMDEFRIMLVKDSRLPNALRGHNLVKLANDVKFPILTFRKEHILRRLTWHAVWAGRYPVPVNFNTLVMEEHNNGRQYLVTPHWETDITQIKELIQEIKNFSNSI